MDPGSSLGCRLELWGDRHPPRNVWIQEKLCWASESRVKSQTRRGRMVGEEEGQDREGFQQRERVKERKDN